MPAEWEPHECHLARVAAFRGDWPGKFEPIPWVYAEIIRNLARHERVELIVNRFRCGKASSRSPRNRLTPFGQTSVFIVWRTDRVWTRDSGCIFLTPADTDTDAGRILGKLLALHFQFNAWAKYSNFAADEKIGGRMAKAASARLSGQS